MSTLLSLTYTSHAADKMSEKDMLNLMEECHRNNEQRGISGLLLFDGKRTFIQALEGESSCVEELYEVIKKDPRHTDIVSLGRREIDEREFPYWRMGFRNVGDIDTRGLGGYSNFMERDNKAYLEENPGFAHSLLLFFRDNAK